MLKLSRREEDFDSLNMLKGRPFQGAPVLVQSILRDYKIYDKLCLRNFCLSDEGMRIDRDNPNWTEVLDLIVFAIEEGIITLKEYLNEYGDEKKFLICLLRRYSDAEIRALTKNYPEFRDKYYYILKPLHTVIRCLSSKEPATLLLDDNYSVGDLVCEVIQNGYANVRDLFDIKRDGNYFIYFLESMYNDSEKNHTCLADKAEEEGIFEELENDKINLLLRCCKDDNYEQAKLLIESFFMYSVEDLEEVYKICLYYGIRGKAAQYIEEKLGSRAIDVQYELGLLDY